VQAGLLLQARVTADSRQVGVLGRTLCRPSTESAGKAAKTETKKKVATTRKGRGKTKTSNGRLA
jgi:hypothetical protein